jgi:uroporphyrinogen decarboxylase
MTSRERMVAAIHHQEPDRVPTDLGSTFVTGIHQRAYANLLDFLGEGDRELLPILDPIQQLATPHEEILDRLGVDTRSFMRYGATRKAAGGWEDADYTMFRDAWGIGWRMPKVGGLYHDMFEHPLAGKGLDEAKAYAWPDPLAGVDLAELERTAKYLANETDKAIIIGGFGSGVLEMVLWLQGFEQGYMNLLAEPELTEWLLSKIVDLKVEFIEAVLPVVGKYCQVFYSGDDVGHQENPAVRPALFNSLLVPLYKRHNDAVKRMAPHLKIFFHTCGCVYPLLPGLIEGGIDILNPVQVNAAQMGDTARLKREFGDALTFWGGVDTQEVLPHGTPQQVKDETRRRIEDLAPGGGYVLDSVHNIQADVPPQNIMAMFEARDEYGWY